MRLLNVWVNVDDNLSGGYDGYNDNQGAVEL